MIKVEMEFVLDLRDIFLAVCVGGVGYRHG